MIWLIVDRNFQSSDIFIRETYKNLTPSSTIIGRGLLDVWLRWDAVHYMNLARYGYSITNIGDFNYPPLYPYLTGIIARLTIRQCGISWIIAFNDSHAGNLYPADETD